MTDEELIARLRSVHTSADDEAAADRIEALVKERDEALEWLSASQGYIADAVFALDKQEKAEARAERLAALLDRAVNGPWLDGDLERARAALTQKEPTDG